MYLIIFILGIVIGSFLNVCICRIPRDESIAFPASHCTYCSTSLSWQDLIPIFSFLSLKGKCRYCGERISPQYPIVELLNGLFYLFTYYAFGLSFDFLFYSLIISILIIISFIDYYHQIIPDRLILTILVLAIIYKSYTFAIYRTSIIVYDSILGFLIGGLLFLLIAIISKGAMGGGDIKLIASLGFILGWKKTILNILLAFIIGALISIILLITKKKGRKDAIPFGPFINLAFLITLLYGSSIINCYIEMILY